MVSHLSRKLQPELGLASCPPGHPSQGRLPFPPSLPPGTLRAIQATSRGFRSTTPAQGCGNGTGHMLKPLRAGIGAPLGAGRPRSEALFARQSSSGQGYSSQRGCDASGAKAPEQGTAHQDPCDSGTTIVMPQLPAAATELLERNKFHFKAGIKS